MVASLDMAAAAPPWLVAEAYAQVLRHEAAGPIVDPGFPADPCASR